MASPSVSKSRRKSAVDAATANASPSRRRASQRVPRGVELKLNYGGKLRPMMIEHSHTEEGAYLTVYAGPRGEFLAAGVPSALIPTAGAVEFQIRRDGPPNRLLDATMSLRDSDRFELEIDWGDEMPYDCGHPAICELARMTAIDFRWSYDDQSRLVRHEPPDLEYPIKELLADKRASDYKPGAVHATRVQISADFHERLNEVARYIRHQILRHGEVFPVQTPQGKKVEPKTAVRLVVDNDDVVRT